MADVVDLNEMGGEMSVLDAPDFTAIDEMISTGEPKLAEAFLETVEELIEALQLVTEARGEDHEDDYERAVNCVRWMQGVAFNALAAAGLKPRGVLIDDEPTIAMHEAAHCVAARALGLPVICATAADGDPHVRIRFQRPEDDAVVALAGLCADHSPEACARDLHNATERIESIVRLRHGLAEDSAFPDAQRAEVAETVANLREKAKALVETNWNAVVRVADALAHGGTLDQAAIDGLIGAE